MRDLRHGVFWPPFLLLLAGVVYSFMDQDGFLATTTAMNNWILDHFSWLFCWTAIFMLLLIVATYFSPLGKVKIGGDDAKPMLTRWRWFSITLCTTVAIGILFWGTAEPLFHLMTPPEFAGVEPGSLAAGSFAMGTMFLHWTLTPYAIYCIPALVFALSYYNRGNKFSLGALLEPLFNRTVPARISDATDAICLYALVAGMAAALGAGMLTLAGGLDKIFGIPTTPTSLAFVGAAIVISFALSSISGLMNGIRLLSDWNAKVFFAMCLFVFIAGPTWFILKLGSGAVFGYLVDILPRTAGFGASGDGTAWVKSWTIFYWAVWMSWAPVTALFLGRIAYGYTVRQFIIFNFLSPAVFCGIWMAVFSSTAINLQMTGQADLYSVMKNEGVQNVVYTFFESLPFAKFFMYLFFGVSFLSFVTAADSNTSAMGGISSNSISPDKPEAKMGIKLLWGILVGVIAWIMVSFKGIEGIKMSSNIGGFPAVFLLVLVSLSLVRLNYDAIKKRGYENDTSKESAAPS